MRRFWASLLVIGWLAPGVGAAEQKVDFARDIRPLFESRCYECHGEKKQKSGIRFDRKSTVFEGGDSGKPLVMSGKSAESILIERLTTSDEDEVMPPKGERLTTQQIELVRAWIDQGAVWPDEKVAEKTHWAYVKPH